MRLVPAEHPIEGAGLCFICQSYVDRQKQKLVDTNYEFDPQFHHPLVGRKYICGDCAHTIGYTIGMVKEEDVEAAKRAVDETRRQLIGLQVQIGSLSSSIEDSVHDVLNLPVLDLPDAVTDKEAK